MFPGFKTPGYSHDVPPGHGYGAAAFSAKQAARFISRMQWLESGLNELDEEERVLVESIYFQRRRQRVLADESGTTPKAIESKLARIRAKLRQFVLQRIKNEQRTL